MRVRTCELWQQPFFVEAEVIAAEEVGRDPGMARCVGEWLVERVDAGLNVMRVRARSHPPSRSTRYIQYSYPCFDLDLISSPPPHASLSRRLSRKVNDYR